jgi:hypothetical protein
VFHYGEFIVHELFDPVAAIKDPQKQIIAFFDVRRTMLDESPTCGCLAIKARQEHLGKHEGIVALGRSSTLNVEGRLVELCKRVGFAQPASEKQIDVLFQGALPLVHTSGESSSSVSAKAAVSTMLEQPAAQMRAATAR